MSNPRIAAVQVTCTTWTYNRYCLIDHSFALSCLHNDAVIFCTKVILLTTPALVPLVVDVNVARIVCYSRVSWALCQLFNVNDIAFIKICFEN